MTDNEGDDGEENEQQPDYAPDSQCALCSLADLRLSF